MVESLSPARRLEVRRETCDSQIQSFCDVVPSSLSLLANFHVGERHRTTASDRTRFWSCGAGNQMTALVFDLWMSLSFLLATDSAFALKSALNARFFFL